MTTIPLDASPVALHDAFDDATLAVLAGDSDYMTSHDRDFGFGVDVGGSDMEFGVDSFTRLHLDTNLLALYESPSFDEATAVPLDALAVVASPPEPTRSAKRVKTTSTIVTHDDPTDAAAHPIKTEHDTDHDGNVLVTAATSATHCRYRKGKCANLRTRKKNGDLHSYCEFHRQRSIVNQRRFDLKKRTAQSHVWGSTSSKVVDSRPTEPAVVIKQEPIESVTWGRPSDDAGLARPAAARRVHDSNVPHVIEADALWL